MAAPGPRLADLSDADRRDLESWLVAFDERRDEGILASRVEQIPPGCSWRLSALAEMVKIDLVWQWQRGRQVSLESYLKQFPELGNNGDVSADLILAEYAVRRQFGAPAALEDYLRRFPHQAGALARLIARGDSAQSRARPASDRPAAAAPVEMPGPAPQPLPAQFGRYRIIRRLGQGGMGSVYLAEDTQLRRRVALKVPDFGVSDGPEARRRFLHEARAAATLDHAYLCPVYDVGEVDGRLYLTMAFIEGPSLAAAIGAAGWPPRKVAALVGKLALAMQEAHAKGVIHRDLKPANVMIKSTGQGRVPVIVDFGVARRDDPEEVRLTRRGQIMGTLGYMAPEQVRSDLKAIGPACDIYALGVILYELLTGRLPFSGTGLAVVGQILTQIPLPPATFRPGLDPRIAAICLKAMAKEVGDRYASMSELAAALTDYLRSAAAVPAALRPTSDQPPQATANSALVDELLDHLAGGPAAPPIRAPEPVATPAPLPGRHRPRSPWIVAAAALGVALLCLVILYVTTSKGRIKIVVDGPKAVVKVDGEEVGIKGLGAPITLRASAKQITNSIGMKLVLIPSGDFLMGSPDSDKDALDDEKPQHRVQVTPSFYLGATEVTQGQYRAVTGQSPSYFKGSDDLPVGNVSWSDALAFCEELSKREQGQLGDARYRLPTEAEWEYACRAGSTTRFCFGDDPVHLIEFAWYRANSDKRTHPVGQKQPNAWGLYDMHGNAWEWCQDGYDRNDFGRSPGAGPRGPLQTADRVRRGGCWYDPPQLERSAFRLRGAPGERTDGQGLRVARVPSEPSRRNRDTVSREKAPESTPKPGTGADLTVLPKPIINSIGMKLALIPAGEFLMGAPDSQRNAQNDEKPQHRVRITRPFYLGVTEVTHGQYRAVTGADPSFFKGSDDLPVEQVSSFEAIRFCNALSEKEGLKRFYKYGPWGASGNDGYRLPTAAEWEYACRARSTTRFSFGDDAPRLSEFAWWFCEKTGNTTHPVGRLPPNALGLHDMHGNVLEWCQDWYDADYYRQSPGDDPAGPPAGTARVSRGGGWHSGPQHCRSGSRVPYPAGSQDMVVGFRVARFLAVQPEAAP
jgi:formylglycine-generating enzyme required for sulfatase activity/serine/threonine protein kinase